MRDFLDANGNVIEKLYRMAVTSGQEQHIEACTFQQENSNTQSGCVSLFWVDQKHALFLFAEPVVKVFPAWYSSYNWHQAGPALSSTDKYEIMI